jgi:hypothetical protein
LVNNFGLIVDSNQVIFNHRERERNRFVFYFPEILTGNLTRGGEGIRTLIDSLAAFDSAGERIAALPPHR